ncbi:ABC transporter permease [Pyramidobacter sp. C12-8]|nr:ABC transporter permease [Pyramidobacter sp. C12-8]
MLSFFRHRTKEGAPVPVNKSLLKYLSGSLTRMLLLLASASMLSFFLVTASPMNAVDAFLGEINVSDEQRAHIEEQWDLDKPPLQRYVIWAKRALHGDLGRSVSLHQPVASVLRERFKASLLLMGTAWTLSGALGLVLGVAAGTYRDSWLDKIVRTFSLVLASTPTFWIGLLVLVVFAVELRWFPLGLSIPIGRLASEVTWGERLHHLVLPALTLSITGVANIALHTRQKLIDVLESEYVVFARARGETLGQIIRRHGLRNIALPAVTLQCASVSELFGGSVLAEKVFSYPGLGATAVEAGLHADAPLLMGIALFSVLFVFAGNLAANLIYGFVDPQIREGGRSSV